MQKSRLVSLASQKSPGAPHNWVNSFYGRTVKGKFVGENPRSCDTSSPPTPPQWEISQRAATPLAERLSHHRNI